jgi:hypothetical protein
MVIGTVSLLLAGSFGVVGLITGGASPFDFGREIRRELYPTSAYLDRPIWP